METPTSTEPGTRSAIVGLVMVALALVGGMVAIYLLPPGGEAPSIPMPVWAETRALALAELQRQDAMNGMLASLRGAAYSFQKDNRRTPISMEELWLDPAGRRYISNPDSLRGWRNPWGASIRLKSDTSGVWVLSFAPRPYVESLYEDVTPGAVRCAACLTTDTTQGLVPFEVEVLRSLQQGGAL
jgi:hypothetical protein